MSGNARVVLVTGGSGYIASWAIVGLLRGGYCVRTTVRSLSREADLRAMVAQAVDPGDKLTVVAADLLADDGWDVAARGADYVLHMASPLPTGEYRGSDLIRPAREGVRRVIAAAIAAGAKRVVLTSSVDAARPGPDWPAGRAIDENVWTDLPARRIHAYPRAKTFAELDARCVVDAAGGAIELTTILPSFVLGPVLGPDYSASVDLIRMMLAGRLPLLPRIGLAVVDVRDLVDLHIAAMTAPAAAGERFIAAGQSLWAGEVASILREALGPAAARVGRRIAPDAIVRIAALFSAELAQLAPLLGVRPVYCAAKAERLLGWRARPARESIVDAASSLIGQEIVSIHNSSK